MQKYKKDSPFAKGCRPNGEGYPDWKPDVFKYKWLELWQRSNDGWVGLARISKSMPLYWKGAENLIYGVAIIQTGINVGTKQEWIRVVRKTEDSVIIPNPDYKKV